MTRLALARSGRAARRAATALCSLELVGVLAVGTLSALDAERFPEATVWSGYGSGYLYVPLVLPVLGLAWLAARRGASAAPVEGGPGKEASHMLER